MGSSEESSKGTVTFQTLDHKDSHVDEKDRQSSEQSHVCTQEEVETTKELPLLFSCRVLESGCRGSWSVELDIWSSSRR